MNFNEVNTIKRYRVIRELDEFHLIISHSRDSAATTRELRTNCRRLHGFRGPSTLAPRVGVNSN